MRDLAAAIEHVVSDLRKSVACLALEVPEAVHDDVKAKADAVLDKLEALDAWASRMPDAGFNDQDPRWGWWNERPR